VLDRLGYEVIVPDGLRCCGRPFLSLGDPAAARTMAERNTALLRSVNAEAIVTACASCGLTFKREYPALLAPSGMRPSPVLDIHEFLERQMGRLDLETISGRITVHDPCHLGRGQALTGTVRNVLAAVPGLDLVEMQEPERCCGFGGVMRATHPDLSMVIGRAKAMDIMGTGAPLAVTGCPGCKMQIRDALRRTGAAVEVVHTVQVIERAVRRQGSGVRGDGRETAGAVMEGQGSGTERSKGKGTR
jgi:glycolate oxidase iron-sulfur subunit